jgi:septal ring factor EnvC (AmiA/AmiB activator)
MVNETTPLETAAADPTAEELERRLQSSEEEVLRLRDLLIRRDSELGAAKGRLAMMEERSKRLANAAARVPIPGAKRVLHRLIRLLQRSSILG